MVGCPSSAGQGATTRGKLLIQADEDFDPAPNPDGETSWGYGHIYDISDKTNPAELATLKRPSTTQSRRPDPATSPSTPRR